MAAPVFVKIEKYNEVNDSINRIKSKLEDAKSALKKINELKAQEDREIRAWQEELNKMEQKISFITDRLSKPETL